MSDNSMRIIRVFPRRTRATPDDELAFVGDPTLFAEADETHISVTFSWDTKEAERLQRAWRHVAPVKIGGPAVGTKGDGFVPGRYLKYGYTITSRGCPNRCWFCSVWQRDGDIRELPIQDGWDILDDNLLACSDEHIKAVFSMLSRQLRRPKFTGGIEAKRVKPWIAKALYELKPERIYMAYDTPDDRDALASAVQILRDGGFGVHPKAHVLSAYVLIGYRGDTFERAESRLRFVGSLGVMPYAMLWKDDKGTMQNDWRKFQRTWVRPHIVASKISTQNNSEGL